MELARLTSAAAVTLEGVIVVVSGDRPPSVCLPSLLLSLTHSTAPDPLCNRCSPTLPRSPPAHPPIPHHVHVADDDDDVTLSHFLFGRKE